MRLLADALEQSFDQQLYSKLETATIGRIDKIIDAEIGLVSVTPVISKTQNNKEVKLGRIENVPLQTQNIGKFSIQYPEDELIGTYVLLVVCSRSIDTWISNNNIQVPDINTKFDLSDCIAIPGIINKKKGSLKPAIGKTLKINMDDSFIEFENNGTVNVNGHLTVDL